MNWRCSANRSFRFLMTIPARSRPASLLPKTRSRIRRPLRTSHHPAVRSPRRRPLPRPNNLYSLSNLGVVYFRSGKLKAAELTFKKAVALSPKDEFTHTTLGIVYYRQSKFDEALTELTKSLGLNPKSATAHNYLGI